MRVLPAGDKDVIISDYAVAYLFNDVINIITPLLMRLASKVFAILVASNTVAHKLKPGKDVLVIALFTIASSILIFLMNRCVWLYLSTAKEIREMLGNGQSSLGWHPVVLESVASPTA